jgi:hypothetical protein
VPATPAAPSLTKSRRESRLTDISGSGGKENAAVQNENFTPSCSSRIGVLVLLMDP